MSKSPERLVHVEPFDTGSGWSVRTAFLKNPVGNYLGKSTGLSKQEAEQLCVKWMEMQRVASKQSQISTRPVKRKGYLKEGA